MMDIALTLDDFRACDWPAVTVSVAIKECVAYCDAYLSSALTLENGPVFEFSVHQMERALRLSMMLRNTDLVNRVVSHIEAVIDRQQPNEPLRCAHLMDLLIEVRAGDPATQAARTK